MTEDIAVKNLEHWHRLPQMEEAHKKKGPTTKVPQDQKYTLHGRIEADFSKYLTQVDWKDHDYAKLLTEKKERVNYSYSEQMKSLVYSYSNTQMKQKIMKDDHNPIESFFIKCAKATRLKNAEFMLCMQPPGNMTPWHQDFFCAYRERHKLDIPESNIYNVFKRYWMPLENWKTGHFYQSNNTVYWGWKAGDLYAGPGDTPHLAVTAGIEPRYFAQITGMVDNDDYLGKNGFETIVIN